MSTNSNSSSGTEEYRGSLLLDATKQFCGQKGRVNPDESKKYSELFFSLIGSCDGRTRKQISSHLARNHNTTRQVAYYLALEPAEIAAPFLLFSPVLWERDLLQLIEKLEVDCLAILARRSDVSPKVAQALVSRGDKSTCQVLANNPVLKLNGLAKSVNTEIALIKRPENAQDIPQKQGDTSPGNELMALANVGGRLGRSDQRSQANEEEKVEAAVSFEENLLVLARAGNHRQIATEMATHIDMPIDEVHKIVTHVKGSSLILFLKGMGISRAVASQLLLLLNKRAGRNILEFTSSMEIFDRFSMMQCQDMMKNLGAGDPAKGASDRRHKSETSRINTAADARRSQIRLTRAPVLFGAQAKTG